MGPMRLLIGFGILSAAAVTVGATSSLEWVPQEASRARAAHLLERATFGSRPGQIESVVQMGPGHWLDWQLDPASIPDPHVARALAGIPEIGLAPTELAARFSLDPEARARLQADGLSPEERRRVRGELADRAPGRILGSLVMERMLRSTRSERQLEEVMTQFWFDHFNVFWGKGADRYLVGDYERTAIRPNVFGTFEELLLATARHPAMLVYLDAARSVEPQVSERMRRRAEQADRPIPGLNENYARELLELHTLGVDGGYTQDDVVAVARVFTGWTVVLPARNRERGQGRMSRGEVGDPFTFIFRPELHATGDKTVLGTRIPAGGRDEGERVLRLLAGHPSTATHVARQLATAFVADEAPEALVDDLARAFLESGGDLRVVTKALFTHERFYDPAYRGARVKSPFRMVASALRATEAQVVSPRGLLDALRTLGHVPYLATAPTGYPEESEYWGGAGALIDRSDFVLSLAAGRVRGIQVDAGSLSERAQRTFPNADPHTALIQWIAPSVDPVALSEKVRLGLESMGQRESDTRTIGREAGEDGGVLGLILASPEFQSH